MSRKLIILVLLPILLLAACGEAQDEPDFDATVAAAVAATAEANVAAAPTAADLPPTTPPEPTDLPPTTTSEPAPAPTEVPVLDLTTAGLLILPADANVRRTVDYSITVEDRPPSALRVDATVNADATGATTYDFNSLPQVTVAETVTLIQTAAGTYYDLGDESCATAETVDESVAAAIAGANAAALNADAWLTGQLPWTGMVEVNGVETNEYSVAAANLAAEAGFADLTRGVLNVAVDGKYIVRLLLEGTGTSDYLAPDQTGVLFYERNVTTADTPFEIVVPPYCLAAAATATPAAAPALPTPEAELVVAQSADTVFHECQGGNIVVAGAGNSVVLGGACGIVLVNGVANSLEIANAASIVVNGATNTITYSGSPVISDNGIGNVFAQR